MAVVEDRVAVVTGANRGIGREVARQLSARGYAVVLTGRDLNATQAAAREIAEETGNTTWAQEVDVTSEVDVTALGRFLQREVGQVDVVVNNAGAILPDANLPVLKADAAAILQNIDVNTMGALRVTRAAEPLLRENGGNVVNVSSGMGGLNEMGAGSVGYRLSKSALNALTIVLHHELAIDGVRVNAVCPGWVRTDMGGPNANRPVEEGAASVVWAATLEEGGPSGGFFRDGNRLDW